MEIQQDTQPRKDFWGGRASKKRPRHILILFLKFWRIFELSLALRLLLVSLGLLDRDLESPTFGK